MRQETGIKKRGEKKASTHTAYAQCLYVSMDSKRVPITLAFNCPSKADHNKPEACKLTANMSELWSTSPRLGVMNK